MSKEKLHVIGQKFAREILTTHLVPRAIRRESPPISEGKSLGKRLEFNNDGDGGDDTLLENELIFYLRM